MKPLTDAEKIRMLMSSAAHQSDDATDTSQERVRKLVKISRTKLYTLLRDNDNLKRDHLRRRLDIAWRHVFVEPGSAEYRERLNEIRIVLGDDRAALPNIQQIDRYLIDLAYHVWAADALNETLPPAQRLLQGRMAHRVMYDWLKHAKRRGAVSLFAIDDAEVTKRGLEVVDTMVGIVSAHPKAPEGFFEEGTDVARRNGYRMFRVTLASDHLGWLVRKPGFTTADATKALADAYARRVHEDMAWLATIQPHDIAWWYNPWVMAIHAGDWKGSLKLAAALFTKWPILTSMVAGIMPVKDDPDVWPGIAAILEDSDAEALDGLRARFGAADPELAAMIAAAKRAQPWIAENGSYGDVAAAINGGEMK